MGKICGKTFRERYKAAGSHVCRHRSPVEDVRGGRLAPLARRPADPGRARGPRLAGARRDFDSAEAIFRAEAQLVSDPAIQEQTAYTLADLSLRKPTLDDVFLALTGHGAEDSVDVGEREVAAP